MNLQPLVLDCVRVTIGRDWTDQNVFSPFWRVYYNRRHGAEVLVGNGTYKIVPGRVHVIPAWVRFSCRCRSHVDHTSLHMMVDGLPGVVSRRIFVQPFALRTCAPLQAMIRQVDRGKGMPEMEFTRHCRTQAIASLVLGQAVAALAAPARRLCRPFLGGSHRFSNLLAYIDLNLDQSLANAHLAQYVHLSPGQFIRRFHSALGQTPAAYVRERRITVAAQRLRSSEDTIERIAAECGFAGRFYFTRVFNHLLGTSPAAYRKRRWI